MSKLSGHLKSVILFHFNICIFVRTFYQFKLNKCHTRSYKCIKLKRINITIAKLWASQLKAAKSLLKHCTANACIRWNRFSLLTALAQEVMQSPYPSVCFHHSLKQTGNYDVNNPPKPGTIGEYRKKATSLAGLNHWRQLTACWGWYTFRCPT